MSMHWCLLKRTLEDTDKGFGGLQISYDEDALRTLADMSGGDCRSRTGYAGIHRGQSVAKAVTLDS